MSKKRNYFAQMLIKRKWKISKLFMILEQVVGREATLLTIAMAMDTTMGQIMKSGLVCIKLPLIGTPSPGGLR